MVLGLLFFSCKKDDDGCYDIGNQREYSIADDATSTNNN